MTEKKYESDLTPKEKRQMERDLIKSMSWPNRLQHIWAYYKPQMVIILAMLCLLYLIGFMIYRSNFDTMLSVAIVNGVGQGDAMAQEFKEYCGDTDKYHEYSIDCTMTLVGDEQSDYNSVIKLSTVIGAQNVDVVVLPKDQFDDYAELGAFYPMDEVLTEEQMETLGNAVSEYALHVPNNEKFAEFENYPGEDAYLGVLCYVDDLSYARKFISYISEGELE